MGIGDWGLGIGDWAQSPIPNPQSPIPIIKSFNVDILIYNKKINNNLKLLNKINIYINVIKKSNSNRLR